MQGRAVGERPAPWCQSVHSSASGGLALRMLGECQALRWIKLDTLLQAWWASLLGGRCWPLSALRAGAGRPLASILPHGGVGAAFLRPSTS